MIHAWMRGQYTSEQIAEWLAPKLKLDQQLICRELERSCQAMKLLDQAILDFAFMFRETDTLVAIATDNMDTFTRWTVAALELAPAFDAIINSADIGYLKTDVGRDGSLPFFANYLAEHDLQPSDCVLIDDGERLGPLARSAGFGYRLVTPHRTVIDHLQVRVGQSHPLESIRQFKNRVAIFEGGVEFK